MLKELEVLQALQAFHAQKQDIFFNFDGSHLDRPQRGRVKSIDEQAMTVSLEVEFGQRWFEATIPIKTFTCLGLWVEQPDPHVELVLEPAAAVA